MRHPQHPCPNCNGFARIPVRSEDGTTHNACARCGFVPPPLPFSGQEGGIGGGRMAQPTPLQVGMRARIHGKEYFLVGFLRYESRDDEGTISKWFEFVLMNPDGDTRYLEFDDGKWTITQPIPSEQAPAHGQFPNTTPGTIIRSGGRASDVSSSAATSDRNGTYYSVSDSGTCEVTGVEGQIPWPVRRNQPLHYVDMQSGGTVYSAEFSEGEGEWFKGERTDARAVYTWFNLQDELKRLDSNVSRRGDWAKLGGLAILIALLTFFLAGANSGIGKVVDAKTVFASQIGEGGQVFGPYHLNRINRVYRLRLASQLSSSAMYVQGIVEVDPSTPLFDAQGDFWDESGRDADGPWHESSLKMSSDFRLDAPKDVYVRIMADSDAAMGNAPISFWLEEVEFYSLYLWTLGIVLIVIGTVWLTMGFQSESV